MSFTITPSNAKEMIKYGMQFIQNNVDFDTYLEYMIKQFFPEADIGVIKTMRQWAMYPSLKLITINELKKIEIDIRTKEFKKRVANTIVGQNDLDSFNNVNHNIQAARSFGVHGNPNIILIADNNTSIDLVSLTNKYAGFGPMQHNIYVYADNVNYHMRFIYIVQLIWDTNYKQQTIVDDNVKFHSHQCDAKIEMFETKLASCSNLWETNFKTMGDRLQSRDCIFKQDNDRLHKRVIDTNNTIQALSKEVDHHKRCLKEHLNSIIGVQKNSINESKFIKLSEKVDTTNNVLEQKISSINNVLTQKISSINNTLDQKIDTIKNSITNQVDHSTIHNMQKTIETLRAHSSETNELNKKVDTLSNEKNKLKKRIATLEQSIADKVDQSTIEQMKMPKDRFIELSTKVDELTQKIDTMSAENATLKQSLDDMTERATHAFDELRQEFMSKSYPEYVKSVEIIPNYDYELIKAKRRLMHQEYFSVFKFFKRLIHIRYNLPVAIAVSK